MPLPPREKEEEDIFFSGGILEGDRKTHVEEETLWPGALPGKKGQK